jgi:hypothetical protein
MDIPFNMLIRLNDTSSMAVGIESLIKNVKNYINLIVFKQIGPRLNKKY